MLAKCSTFCRPFLGIGPEDSPLEPKICEEFQGFVEKIEGDKAYIRLDSQRGERLCGPYPADELTAVGIGERDRFLLKAVEVNGAIRFDAVLIPRKKISPERQRQIREEIEAGLEGFTPDYEHNEPKPLEVHVLGAGRGESIILSLPDGGWGVVDCCASSSRDESKNATLEFLRALRGIVWVVFSVLEPYERLMPGPITASILKLYARIQGE